MPLFAIIAIMAMSKRKNEKNMLTGIAVGAPLGTFLGWILFDNIGLGALIGTASGAIIGALIDEKAKK